MTVLLNAATGEKVTILRSTPEMLRIRIDEPAGKGAPRHLHPNQEEHIWVMEGAIKRDLPDHGSDVLRAGDEWVLSPGTPHTWTATDGPATVEIEFRPALATEAFLVELTRIAARGEMNSKGVPNPLRVSLLAPRFDREIEITSPPMAVQKLVFGLLAPLARRLLKD